MTVNIFIAYESTDEVLAVKLEEFLARFQQSNRIRIYKNEINQVDSKINTYLNAAHIILLLVSPNFLNSDYCYRDDMLQAIKRHELGEARVLPIILRPVYWKRTPFAKLQVVPKDAQPITLQSDQEAAFEEIAATIENAVSEIEFQELSAPSPVNLPTLSMAKRCVMCSCVNPAGTIFCIRCGSRIVQAVPLHSEVASSSGSLSAAMSQLLRPPDPGALPQPTLQMGTEQTPPTKGVFSLRHAFAGYGVSVAHHSWLLSGAGRYADAMDSSIRAIFSQRGITGLKLSYNHLRERGSKMEERRYLMVQRGMVTVFIYVAPAGHDLYISRTTLVQLSIDPLRIAFLGILTGGAFFLPSILDRFMPSLTALPFALVPLLVYALVSLYLIGMLLRSLRYWIIERDFWIYLRVRELNSFQFDNIMLLEHATDESVYEVVKQLGLDTSKVSTPGYGYQPQRRIHII